MKSFLKHSGWLLLSGLLLLSACGTEKTADDEILSEEQKESVEVRPEVIFTIADSLPIYQYVESRGVVEASKKVVLQPKISGFVAESNIAGGRWIEEDQLLLQFDKSEWLYALNEAKNQYQKALSKYTIEKKMRGATAAGTAGRDSAKSDEMIRITTGLTKAKLSLKRAKLDLSYTTMRAPFSGRLATDRRIAEGSFVAAGTKLGVLVNDATVRVHFDVLEAELAKIETDMSVDIFTPAGRAVHGTVTAVSPVVDTQTKTGEVIVTVQNRSGWLRSGMTVEGRIQIKKQTGKVRVPREAILSRGGRTLLFKLHSKNNEVQWIYIKPVAVNGKWALINNPKLEPGDTIAVDNHFAMSHLQIVEPKMRLMEKEQVE